MQNVPIERKETSSAEFQAESRRNVSKQVSSAEEKMNVYMQNVREKREPRE